MLKSGAKLASKSGSMIIRNGKIVIKSLQKGFMKGAKKLQGLVDRILQKFKFKKFKLVRKGKHIRLYGEVNPWVLLIDGKMKDVNEKQLEKLELKGKKPISLSDAEYEKISTLKNKERAYIAKNADGDKSKINFDDLQDLENPLTRLPRTNGKWEGEPGNGKWYSDNSDALSVTGGSPVEFNNNRPVFSPWSRGKLKFKPGQLDGSDNDFKLVYESLMKSKGFSSGTQAKNWLRKEGLTPHHLDHDTIELIPTKLHKHIPHVGSASDLRGGY
ncbi:HNH endonuclease [Paenibacillus sp. FSL R5-0912]|uniref:HNH endonuclease n=1 Tax=Paenibacillus sp. FSL R5-0912 TaxID=1536771 RepID=UPI000693779B|nr:HNH endonuclease [Paenibacillus sp. FSL R5-0912]